MIAFWLNGLCCLWTCLDVELCHAAGAPPDAPLPAERLQRISEVLGAMSADLLKIGGFADTARIAERLSRRLARGDEPWLMVRMVEALDNFRGQFLSDCDRHKWVRVDERYAPYFDHPYPWGESVYELFPEARQDVIDAGLAAGAELYTASVFHSMRIAEVGLKWLARLLDVELYENKGKPLPIDEAMWQKIIDGINTRIKAERSTDKGLKRREQLDAYARAAAHCDYMKDIWRNNVSHSHGSYDALEAASALSRVFDFMRQLEALR
jgi:hypothetical protein